MADDDCKLHIAMFPWLAFGHMIPYLELAKLMAQKGHKISYISTPRNIDRLPKLPPNLCPLINFVKINLPHVPNLPENAEATVDLPFHKVKYLKIAFDGLEHQTVKFLESSSPDWVLHDFAPHWLGPIAAKLNISTAFFSIYTAANLCQAGPPSVMMSEGTDDDFKKPEDFTVKPKWVPFKTTVTSPFFFEIQRMFKQLVTGEEDGTVSDFYRLGAVVKFVDAVAIRSSEEFEPEWLHLLEQLYQKPIIQVGELPTRPNSIDGNNNEEEWAKIKHWLDEQERRTVVYVAFGSETKPSQNELTELALGLELSGLPFFWVLRNQRGSSDTEATHLPDGFEERTKGSGVVCTTWAPQVKILSHESVGGLLCHGGWSSVVEAVQFERALVFLPFLLDQGTIARLLAEKKMGYIIPRDDRDGSLTRDSVALSLRLVMVEEEGKVYRNRVKEMRGVFGDLARQDRYVDNLLTHLQNHRTARLQ